MRTFNRISVAKFQVPKLCFPHEWNKDSYVVRSKEIYSVDTMNKYVDLFEGLVKIGALKDE